jgi:hypothetical protein
VRHGNRSCRVGWRPDCDTLKLQRARTRLSVRSVACSDMLWFLDDGKTPTLRA